MRLADVFPAGRGFASRGGARLAWPVLLVLFFVARVGLALDIVTTDGKYYEKCEVVKVEPDALRIIHKDGAARIAYEKLPMSLQKQYFDPAQVAAYHQQIEEEKQATAARVAEMQRQQAIAAAIAEEVRQQQEEARQQEAAEMQRKEEEKAAVAQRIENLRLAAKRHKAELVTGLIGLGGLVSLFLYFLPTIIARQKSNALAIFVFNLFFGWSGIGWIAALVWACTKDSAMDVLARQQLDRPPGADPFPQVGRFRDAQLPDQERVPKERQLEDQGQIEDGAQPGKVRRLRDSQKYLE